MYMTAGSSVINILSGTPVFDLHAPLPGRFMHEIKSNLPSNLPILHCCMPLKAFIQDRANQLWLPEGK